MQTSAVAKEKDQPKLDVTKLNEVLDVYLHYNDKAFQECRARGIPLREYAAFENQMNREINVRLR